MKKCVLIYIYHLSVGEDIILMHVMSGNPEHTQVHSDQWEDSFMHVTYIYTFCAGFEMLPYESKPNHRENATF